MHTNKIWIYHSTVFTIQIKTLNYTIGEIIKFLSIILEIIAFVIISHARPHVPEIQTVITPFLIRVCQIFYNEQAAWSD